VSKERDYTRKVLTRLPDGSVVTAQRNADGSVTPLPKAQPKAKPKPSTPPDVEE